MRDTVEIEELGSTGRTVSLVPGANGGSPVREAGQEEPEVSRGSAPQGSRVSGRAVSWGGRGRGWGIVG